MLSLILMYQTNHHQNQDTEYVHHASRFLVPLYSIFFHFQPLTNMDLISLSIVLPFPEYYRNSIRLYLAFCII